jgi:metal-sulfur cluster biosynthetic enzyme
MTEQPISNQAHWHSEETDPELTAKLREGLREITDPEIGLDIVQLGLIRDVKIEPDFALIKMILTSIYCPYGPAMLETTRQKAEQILERPARLELGMEMWDFSMMEDGAAENLGWF